MLASFHFSHFSHFSKFRSCLAVLFVTASLAACGGGGEKGAGFSGPRAAAAAPLAETVSIPANAAGMGAAAFGTAPLVITTGTAVTWTNNDTVAHTATSTDGVWDSGTLQPGQSFTFTFNTPGTFNYISSNDGAASMSGIIQVNAAPTASPTPIPTGNPNQSPIQQ